MKNQEITLINQINHIINKNNLNLKILSITNYPKELFECLDDFDGEYYVEETNPQLVVDIKTFIPFSSILKTRFIKDFEKLQYKWNKRYKIDVDIDFSFI